MYSAPSAAAKATALVSEPPRPSVVMLPFSSIPWNPATMTMKPASSFLCILSAPMLFIRAFVWASSVSILICEPVKLIAFWPVASIAIAMRETVCCSPVLRSMSISRLGGFGFNSSASAMSWSVCLPRAEQTITTCLPVLTVFIARVAARRIFSASATDVPPNF